MNKAAVLSSLVCTALVTTVVALTSSAQQDQTRKSNVTTLQEQDSNKSSKLDYAGTKLPVEPRCLDADNPNEVRTIVLPSGQTLVGVCNLLLLVDAKQELMWQLAVPQQLFAFAYLQSTGLIYGTAGDNNMFIVEASSGKELVRHSRNGSAAYGQVKQYNNDICLITDDNSGYRDRLGDPSIKDAVTAWRGTEELWTTDLPPGSELIVNGNRILAITNTKKGVYVKEIAVPKAKTD